MILADGTFLTASDEQNEDLFWALRGGGGNFGIVTSFTFRCHEVADVIAGPVFYDLDDAAAVLSWWREFGPAQPDELNGFFAYLSGPPGRPSPRSSTYERSAGSCGATPATRRTPRACARPAHSAARCWTESSRCHCPRCSQPSTGSIRPVISGTGARTSSRSCPTRRSSATSSTVWCVDYWEATRPYSMGGAYVNFMMDEGQQRVQATYGDNYQRLAQIKAKYDPDNFFRVNQSIRPA